MTMSAAELRRLMDEAKAKHDPLTHGAHREMDLATNACIRSISEEHAAVIDEWLEAIEGHHVDGQPYPLGAGS